MSAQKYCVFPTRELIAGFDNFHVDSPRVVIELGADPVAPAEKPRGYGVAYFFKLENRQAVLRLKVFESGDLWQLELRFCCQFCRSSHVQALLHVIGTGGARQVPPVPPIVYSTITFSVSFDAKNLLRRYGEKTLASFSNSDGDGARYPLISSVSRAG